VENSLFLFDTKGSNELDKGARTMGHSVVGLPIAAKWIAPGIDDINKRILIDW